MAPGDTTVTVTGRFGVTRIADGVTWTLHDRSGAVRIAVGAIGPVLGTYGQRYAGAKPRECLKRGAAGAKPASA